MQALIHKVGHKLIRRRYITIPELIAGVYAALIQYLEEHDLIRTGPFDSAPCRKATLSIDAKKLDCLSPSFQFQMDL
jgi:ATP-dependent DNA helicase RecG